MINIEYSIGGNHINGIESFWSFSTRRLTKFNGLTNDEIFLCLKECEFRFNNINNKGLIFTMWNIWSLTNIVSNN